VKLLLDTHILLWWLNASTELSDEAIEMIASPEAIVFVSAVSIWEIRIKQSLGKVKVPEDFAEVLSAEAFEQLPVRFEHAHAVCTLPPLHRDPFDRMLLAQAKLEKFTLVTHDDILARYDIPVLVV